MQLFRSRLRLRACTVGGRDADFRAAGAMSDPYLAAFMLGVCRSSSEHVTIKQAASLLIASDDVDRFGQRVAVEQGPLGGEGFANVSGVDHAAVFVMSTS
jgi:hypothetical protein